MMRRLTFLLLAACALLLFSCAKKGEQGDTTPPGKDVEGRTIRVVATTGMIADIARNVGGGRVAVMALMGPGVDPHLYKASEGDVSRMAGADLILYNGLHLEGKMTEVFQKMGKVANTVAVTDGIARSLLLAPPEFKGAYDPHVWFDVSLWMKAVVHVRDSLARLDPGSEETFRENTEKYLQELSDLHAHVKTLAASIPEKRRVLITAHDAFNYFGRAYGFEVRGLQGISTVAEAGTADIQDLSKFIVKRRIPAVFVETSVPLRYIEALRAAVKSRGFDVSIGGNLYSDAMGTAGTPEGSYAGMVRHNIRTITDALVR